MTWYNKADNYHEPTLFCCWCNRSMRDADEGVVSGGELVCADCCEYIYGRAGWDRMRA